MTTILNYTNCEQIFESDNSIVSCGDKKSDSGYSQNANRKLSLTIHLKTKSGNMGDFIRLL